MGVKGENEDAGGGSREMGGKRREKNGDDDGERREIRSKRREKIIMNKTAHFRLSNVIKMAYGFRVLRRAAL